MSVSKEKRDIVEKEFIGFPDVAADTINVLLYQGTGRCQESLGGSDGNNLSDILSGRKSVSGSVGGFMQI